MSEQFDPKELKGAIVDVNKAFEEFKNVNDANLKERDVVLEEKLDKVNKDLEAAQSKMDEAFLAQKRAARVVTDAHGKEIDLDAKAADFGRQIGSSLNRKEVEMSLEGMTDYKSIAEKYYKGGMDVLDIDERKALSVGGDPTGGYVVHPDMSGRVVGKVFETSPMRAFASIQTISSDALEGLFDLDEAGAEWVSETQGRSETDTPDLGAWRIPAHELSARPKATQKILDDAEINIEQWLAEKVAAKFARAEATAFVNGSGVTRPRGFLTYPDGTTLPGKIEQFDTGVNGDFAAAPNGGDVLIDALYGLKTQYRNNATWFMNRSTTKATRKLKDSDGAYLWQPGIAAGQPATLLGYPIAPFEDMPDITTGSLSIAVGDMRETYQIVDRIGIRTLRDPYSAKPYVEFYTTKRVGGDVVNFEALKLVNFQA